MYQADLSLLSAARDRTLRMTEGLSQAQADFSDVCGWSIGEILDHILLSEQINRKEIARLIELAKRGQPAIISRTVSDFNIAPAFIPKCLAPFAESPFRILNPFLPAAIREYMVRYRLIPFRNADIATPRKGRMIGQLRKELESSIQASAALLNLNPGLDYRAMVFDQPVLGRNNVLQLLRILASHEQRHQDQIGIVYQSPGYPVGSDTVRT